jgi:hypothetical protein
MRQISSFANIQEYWLAPYPIYKVMPVSWIHINFFYRFILQKNKHKNYSLRSIASQMY